MQWNKSAKIGLSIVLSLGVIGVVYRILERGGYIFPLSLWGEMICETCSQQSAYHQPPSQTRFPAANKSSVQPFGTTIDKLSEDKINKASISILIEKSKYRLTIYQDKQPIKSYPIVLGYKPTGDKFNEGDRRTPEGIFHLRDLYPHPQWSKFLWIDYPNADSWRKHLIAKQSGKIPWYASIGKDVGIHGVPENQDRLIDTQVNWTWGCISLKTADVNEIYQVSRSGTLVEIIP
jgi:murein L,D-transpeptidase YafK